MRENKAKEYLRTIFALELEGPVRGAYIARELNVTKATVSGALKSLVEEGYLVMESDHSVRLTGAGRQMAKEAIHQSVNTSRSYHELARHIEAQEQGSAGDETLLQRRLRWLERERCAALLEAHGILGRRYYCVRAVDLAHFLTIPLAAVRARLKRLEQNDYLRLGEDTVITLTEKGAEAAAQFYAAHAALRESLLAEGVSADEAERRAACRTESGAAC